MTEYQAHCIKRLSAVHEAFELADPPSMYSSRRLISPDVSTKRRRNA